MKAQLYEAQETLLRLLLTQSESCIEWPHARNGGGYGTITIDGVKRGVHAIACEHHHGPSPANTECAHACGNPACLNRLHLRWATRSENQLDRRLHGTSNEGERNPMRKLSQTQVLDIRARCGQAQRSIAAEFGVGQATVSRIRNGLAWRITRHAVDDYTGTERAAS